MRPSAEKDAEAVQELLKDVMEDRSVPKNIRRAVEEALTQMGAKLETVSISNATGGPMPGIDLTDFSALQEMEDLDYVERMKRFK